MRLARRGVAPRKSPSKFGAWVRGWFAALCRAKATLQADAFAEHRLRFEPLEARQLLSATLTTLASFNDPNIHNLPAGGLVEDSSGNLFGTRPGGPGEGSGTVFEVGAQSGAITTLAAFNGTNGASPYAGVVEDGGGNLFGTTSAGGFYGYGTVFEIPAGSDAVTTLVSFSGANGEYPGGGVVEDSSGNLFGTTSAGGAYGDGVVFEVKAGSGTATTLASFTNTNGVLPCGGLVEDSSGNLFGTTTYTYANDTGDGTVFEVRAGSNVVTTLASFSGANGAFPNGSLIRDSSGNLFGMTYGGGSSWYGTVFEVRAGSGAVTTLASFNGSNGASPYASLVEDGSGNLFGTTYGGGSSGDGTLFEVQAGSNAVTTLVSFNGANGEYPAVGLVEDGSGNLFGTTSAGGPGGYGTVFEVNLPLTVTGTATTGGVEGSINSSVLAGATFTDASPGDNSRAFTATINWGDNSNSLGEVDYSGGIYTLNGQHTYAEEGSYPLIISVLDNGGSTATITGTATVADAPLSATPARGPLATLASFSLPNGGDPDSGLVEDGSGNLFGTTGYGGPYRWGTVFEIAAHSGVITTLATFNGANGAWPDGSLIEDRSGNLFGTTESDTSAGYGTVFEVAAQSGVITMLASFSGSNGEFPQSGVIEDRSGNLFGTTESGGSAGDGTVFEVAAGSGAITTLASFSGANGKDPLSGLVEDSAGNLFGTSLYGGTAGDGTLFEIAAGSGVITTLASFSGTNGYGPTGLVEDSSGDLFGVAGDGGSAGDGTVFEVATGSGVITTLASFNGSNGAYPENGPGRGRQRQSLRRDRRWRLPW